MKVYVLFGYRTLLASDIEYEIRAIATMYIFWICVVSRVGPSISGCLALGIHIVLQGMSVLITSK